ncbi:DUF1353 domain-containing protein [Jiella pacifica]|uniref:DUF1353 domain-containing protein n=1 Tax=Jiella pacifica TaxID=2696469 RepID=A0A6N9SVE6_9HYPH|nr:DUF1353 domain-containing protein [Jiella pacifica]NDW03030.1 DUF1353 domain-containing protein [Jiella pacifica]
MADGRFEGRVVVEWLEHGGADRNMQLREAFAFVGEDGARWNVPAGAIVNGASIPQTFWTLFGPPFVGDYRRASVVHDYFCEVRTRPAHEVHRMFYDACRAGGVSYVRAKSMYAAVTAFGPNWTHDEAVVSSFGFDALAKSRGVALETHMAMDDFMELKNDIEMTDPSLDEIDARIARGLQVTPAIPLERVPQM